MEHINDDVRSLALKGCNDPEVDVAFALQQISGRQQIKHKLPWLHNDLRLILPVRLSLEQCSSEDTSTYKSHLIHGQHLMDLTGGFGIDCLALSQHFSEVDYVERDEELYQVVKHNFNILNKSNIRCHHADGIEHLLHHPEANVIYLDPARRDKSGGKVVQISDCEPNIIEHLPLLLQNGRDVWVKLSPMLDLHATLAVLPVVKAYIISVKNECKELLLHLHSNPPENPHIHAVELQGEATQTFTFQTDDEAQSPLQIADVIGNYLYEPSASIMKAGCFKLYSQRFNFNKLDSNSHLYTSNHYVENAHGKCFKVLETYGMDKKSIKQLRADCTQCTIATRNFPISPENLRKKLHLKEGGNKHLFGTTYKGKHLLILTERR